MNHTQEYRFNPNAREGSSLAVNELLQILAEGNGKMRVFTQYELNALLKVGLRHKENGAFEVDLNISDLQITGDTHYRHFSLEDYLQPSFINVDLLVKLPGGKIIQEVHAHNIFWPELMDEDTISTFTLINHRNASDSLAVEIKKIEFHYGDDYFRDVSLLASILSSYYRSDKLLLQVRETLQDLSTYPYENAILEEFQLCEAEIIVANISNEAFWEVSMIEQVDPIKIRVRLDAVRRRLDQQRKDFNQVISHIDSLLYERGVVLIEDMEYTESRKLFERVIVYNPMHVPAHARLGRMELDSLQPEAAMTRFRKLMGEIRVPAIWRDLAGEFTSEIYTSESNRAKEAMEKGRYLDAINILNKLEQFCDSIIQWECPPELQTTLQDAHYGMYQSYLSVARRAYSSANNSFAVVYLQNALEYRLKNQAYITGDSEAITMLQWVTDAYFFEVDEAFMLNDFALAVKLLHEVEDICINHPEIKCHENIPQLIQQAEDKMYAAEKIIVPFTVSDPAVQKPEMTAIKAKVIVQDLLSKGHLKAWAGETTDAREHLNEILHYAIRYELRQDSLLNQRIINLTEMITQKECEFQYRDMNDLLGLIQDFFQREYYTEAYQSYEKALGLQKDSGACRWDFSDTLSKLSYIHTAATYQELMHEAQSAYFRAGQEGFELFIAKYKNAGDFFAENNLDKYGAKHESLYRFASTSSNAALVKVTIIELSDTGQVDEAFELLKILQSQGFAARELRSLQEYAGTKAAIHMHRQNHDLNPAAYIREKTGNQQWFKAYTRSFIRNWPE